MAKNPHDVTTQKTNIDIFTAVRTSNLRELKVLFLTLVYVLS
jgi:hypothetical protein